MKNRIKIALEFLKDGQAFTVGELRLSAEKKEIIEVIGWSKYKQFGNLSKQQCLEELEEIKAQFQKMLESSIELNDFVKNKPIQYNLYFDSYGKGSVSICLEDKNGNIEWEADIEDD